MRFGVIEYTSKSGNIWRHTSEKPNFMCDPIHEMDPTSFGCYVSAMCGQHIPLMHFINPSIIHKVIKRVSGRWPHQYDISYFKTFDVLMIVHQLSDAHEIVRFIHYVKRTFPHIVILGVPTQPFGILKSAWEASPKGRAVMQEFMNACDIFLTIVKSTKPMWQSMTATRVEYVPQPYPVEFAKQWYKERSNKKPIIFVAGVTDRFDIARGQIIARDLQKLFPDMIIHITSTPEFSLDTRHLSGAQFDIIPFSTWQSHLHYLADVMLVINTDYTQTRGRIQMDCAAVGTACIGSDSDAQADLFPYGSATPTTPREQITEIGKTMLLNSTRYDAITSGAVLGMEKYNYENAARRIRSLVSDL